jgi:hypothetical protein
MAKAARQPRSGPSKSASGGQKPPPKRLKKATNLTLDPAAVARGERFGARHGKSLSQVVNELLSALPAPETDPDVGELAPAVRRLYGIAAEGTTDRAAYRDRLIEKYGSARS